MQTGSFGNEVRYSEKLLSVCTLYRVSVKEGVKNANDCFREYTSEPC